MSAPLDPFRVHVADQILAALAEAHPAPLSTAAIQERTGYGIRHGHLVYQALTRLAGDGKVTKLKLGRRACYWRRTKAAYPVPEIRVMTDGGGPDAGEGQ